MMGSHEDVYDFDVLKKRKQKMKQVEHVVKLIHLFYESPWSGLIQLRKNDREYQVGDLLFMHEYDPKNKKFLDRYMARKIIGIVDNTDLTIGQGIAPGWVLLMLDHVDDPA